jgi:hypothetical protein
MTAEERIAQLEQENAQLRAELSFGVPTDSPPDRTLAPSGRAVLATSDIRSKNQKRNREQESFSPLASCGDDKEKQRVEIQYPSFLERISEVECV